MKKIIALMVGVSMLLTCVSCTKETDYSSVTTVEQLTVFHAAQISMGENFNRIYDICESSGKILVFGELKNGDYAGYVTDNTFSEYKMFSFTANENENFHSVALLSSNKKAVLSELDGITRIRIFSGNNIEETMLEIDDFLTTDDSFAKLYSNGSDGFLIQTQNDLTVLTDSGTVKGKIDLGGRTCSGVFPNSSDGMSCLLSDKADTILADIDTKNLNVTNERSFGVLQNSAITLCGSTGDSQCTVVCMDGLYQLNNDTWVKLSDFTDNDFSPIEISGIVTADENAYAVLVNSAVGTELRFLTEEDVSLIKSKKPVQIAATIKSSSLEDKIRAFNSESEDYKAEIALYEDTNALNLAIVSGNAPDVIWFNGEKNSPEYLNTDYFVDLYTLIDNDPDYSREDFLPNVLDCFETDGKLCRIFPDFSIKTVIAMNGITDVEVGWDILDFLNAMSQIPPEHIFDNYNDNTMLTNAEVFARIQSFYDYTNANCNFVNPDYTHYLNYFRDNKLGMTMAESSEGIGIIMSEPYEKAEFKEVTLHQFSSFLTYAHGEYKDTDISFVGYPTINGTGGSFILPSSYSFGIMGYSQNIEGAWEFIKSLFSDEYYTENSEIPILFDQFNAKVEETTQEKEAIYVVDGEEKNLGWVYHPQGSSEYISIEPFTQEECEQFKEFVLSIDQREYTDYFVQNIWEEEMASFFEGECTAEEAVQNVQSRVSIYLSEQYD